MDLIVRRDFLQTRHKIKGKIKGCTLWQIQVQIVKILFLLRSALLWNLFL